MSDKAARSEVIDFWRALACLAVLAYHARCNYFGADLHPWVASLNEIAEHGYLGVRVFFVISGYCLAGSIERCAHHATSQAIAFWKNRLLRILPVYWVALAFAVLLTLVALPFNGLPLSSVLSSDPLLWLANLTLVTEWVRAHPILGVSWSLDYEIGFYLLVGVALLAPGAGTKSRIVYYALITAVAHIPGATEYCPILLYWPAFACGLAVRLASNARLPLSLRCSLAAYPMGLALLSSGEALCPPIFALALLANLAFEKHLPSPPRPLSRLGAASYSIYLIHLPFAAVANLARRFIPQESSGYLFVWFGQIIVGIVAGLLFFALVERPCERLRARLFA